MIYCIKLLFNLTQFGRFQKSKRATKFFKITLDWEMSKGLELMHLHVCDDTLGPLHSWAQATTFCQDSIQN